MPSLTTRPNRCPALLPAACILLACFAARASAEDDAKNPPRPEKRAASDGSEPSGSDDEALLKGLIGPKADQQGDEADLLQRAIEKMRSAEGRIAERDSGPETRALQQQAVDDLAKLIERLQERRRRGGGSSSPRPRPQPQQSEDAEGGDPQTTEGGTPEGGEGRDGNAKESTPGTRDPEQGESQLAGPEEMVRGVWGHLPPRLRRRLLNVYSDKYLPKYDELVRRYFESLAEQGRGEDRE